MRFGGILLEESHTLTNSKNVSLENKQINYLRCFMHMVCTISTFILIFTHFLVQHLLAGYLHSVHGQPLLSMSSLHLQNNRQDSLVTEYTYSQSSRLPVMNSPRHMHLLRCAGSPQSLLWIIVFKQVIPQPTISIRIRSI